MNSSKFFFSKYIILIFTHILLINVNISAQEKHLIIDCFKRQIQLNKQFKTITSISNRQHVESYTEDTLHYCLDMLKNIMCNDFDSNLFKEYIDLLIENSNSSDEAIFYPIGEIFKCAPDSTVFYISKILNQEKKKQITDYLLFSYKNVCIKCDSIQIIELNNFLKKINL